MSCCPRFCCWYSSITIAKGSGIVDGMENPVSRKYQWKSCFVIIIAVEVLIDWLGDHIPRPGKVTELTVSIFMATSMINPSNREILVPR